MTPNSTSSSSIFEDGKLKPGVYKILNLLARSDLPRHPRKLEKGLLPSPQEASVGEGARTFVFFAWRPV